MKRMAVAILVFTQTAVWAGPISTFEGRPPLDDYDSRAKMEDIERCLIDIGNNGLAFVYRQPDRPDAVTIMWQPNMDASRHRLDLHRIPTGTHIKSWMPAKQALDCAPKS